MRLIDADKADVEYISCYYGSHCYIEDVQEWLDEQPTIDAVEVPKGKPGDYLEWDNGFSKVLYRINAVTLERDGNFRYTLDDLRPIVNHANITRIISLEEACQSMEET